MLFELQFRIDGSDASEQDEQQQGTERRDANCDCFDHLYCFPWLFGFSRKGVLRAG